MLRVVGVPELVARDRDDYVTIASRLVGDAAWRAELSARIRDGRARLFDAPEPAQAFADLLLAGSRGA
jgi:predicted O-linked N-acetylglucosamine transferase (SPINDLY family)